MLRKEPTTDYSTVIKLCWTADPEIQKFSRNCEFDLDERVKREVESFDTCDFTFQFFKLYDGEKFIGYFGRELGSGPAVLTTIFIMPEYRHAKEDIWNYIIEFFPETFMAGLFSINTRAISFFKKMGGQVITEIIAEDKPAIVFEFKGRK